MLVASLVLVLLLLAVTGYVVTDSITEARALTESRESCQALWLAEAGIESAEWEIGERQDPDGNGIGNCTGSASTAGATLTVKGGKPTPFEKTKLEKKTATAAAAPASPVSGAYSVTATDAGNDIYRLLSTGTWGSASVTLEVMLREIADTKFPRAAISVVGDVNDFKFEVEKDYDLVVDGGNSPAFAFSDQGIYDRISNEFAKAIASGRFPAANLTGTPLTTFTLPGGAGAVQLPLVHNPAYDTDLENLTSLYDNLVTRASQLRAAASPLPAALPSTLGTPASPVTLHAPSLRSITGKSITGYGTLIIDDRLTLDGGTNLDWTGDIIVAGDAFKDAGLAVDGATLNVTGNVVLLGEGVEKTELEVKSGGQATIGGSLFVGSDWTAKKATKAKLIINSSGQLTVNGLLTMVGPEVELGFETVSSPNNRLEINGMLQIGVPPLSLSGKATDLDVKLEGNVEIYKDENKIRAGVGALRKLGIDYEVAGVARVVDATGVHILSWRRVGQ